MLVLHVSMEVHAETLVIHHFNALAHSDFWAIDVNLKVKKNNQRLLVFSPSILLQITCPSATIKSNTVSVNLHPY